MRYNPSEEYNKQETRIEVYLPNKVPINYEKSLSEGGDCGACVLAGLLGISIEQAYELHESGNYYGGDPIPKISSLSKSSMLQTLKKLETDKLEHIIEHTPIFPFSLYKEQGIAFGLTAGLQFAGWSNYVRALLSGGYYGIAQVKNNGHNENTLNEYGTSDHWILIKGWREQWYLEPKDKTAIGSGMGRNEICISNSARNSNHEQWIYIGDFLLLWGGFDAYWAKLKT